MVPENRLRTWFGILIRGEKTVCSLSFITRKVPLSVLRECGPCKGNVYTDMRRKTFFFIVSNLKLLFMHYNRYLLGTNKQPLTWKISRLTPTMVDLWILVCHLCFTYHEQWTLDLPLKTLRLYFFKTCLCAGEYSHQPKQDFVPSATPWRSKRTQIQPEMRHKERHPVTRSQTTSHYWRHVYFRLGLTSI